MTDRITSEFADPDATPRDGQLRDSHDGFVQDIGTAPVAESSSCHAGRDEMRRAAAKAGSSAVIDRLAADYPLGPHDQPQSMCPAFGSLRVGLRMRRTATILSGSACCVYGLTFTSHFYGARRSVGYVPFQLRDAGHGQAVRGHPRGPCSAWRTRRSTTRSS